MPIKKQIDWPFSHTKISFSDVGELTRNCNIARINCLAHLVGGLAEVSAGILGIGIQDVQGNVAEVVGGAEPVA